MNYFIILPLSLGAFLKFFLSTLFPLIYWIEQQRFTINIGSLYEIVKRCCPIHTKAYRFWGPLKRRITISRDVVFNEQIHDTLREELTQVNGNKAAKPLLSDLMINSSIPVTPTNSSSAPPSSPMHEDNNDLY